MSLVNYSSSSSSSDSDGEAASATNNYQPSKQTFLPSALKQLGASRCCKDDDDDEKDDPAKHGGRIRSFKHERGNWATYIFIPVNSGLFEDVQKLCQDALAGVVDLQLPDDLHISLSKTVILQYHLIDSFIKSLNANLQAIRSFNVSLDMRHLKIYTNEERTRTFLAFEVDKTYFEKLHKLMTCVDFVMQEFKQPQFYKDPSFHISFLWCLGDQVDILKTHLDRLITAQKTLNDCEHLCINVSSIICKSGNKTYTKILDNKMPMRL